MNGMSRIDAAKLVLCIVASQGAGLFGSIFTNMSVTT